MNIFWTKWLAIPRTKILEPPKTGPSGKSKQARRATKRLEKEQQRQQEHLHNGGSSAVPSFVQQELSPQLCKIPRRMTNDLDSPPLDIGPVTVERSPTDKKAFPVDLLFKCIYK